MLKYFLYIIGFAGILTSCMARQKYERPQEVIEENLFRTDKIPQDSLGLGTISWTEIFTDAHLKTLINRGLENNLDIRTALQNIGSAEAYLKQSKTAYFPTLSVSPGYNLVTSSLNNQKIQIGDRSYNNQFNITTSIGWEADLWGKLSAAERAQMASYLGSISTHQQVKSSLVASIATVYYQLITLDAQKNIITQTINLRNQNLETTKALKQAGSLTEVAVKQSEALVHNAQASLINLDNQIVQLENTISLLLGEPSQKIERGTLQNQQLNLKTELGYSASLLSNRPDVRKAELDLINAFELTNVAKAQFYPTLRLTGSGGVQSLDIDKLFSAKSLFANVVAGLAQPILNQRQIKTNYEVSLANKEKAYIAFRKAILIAGKEVSDALHIYQSQDKFIEHKKKELEAYTQSVDYSKELVNYGMANYLEVLNADVNRLNSELNILNAQYTKLQSGVELYRALGGGWK